MDAIFPVLAVGLGLLVVALVYYAERWRATAIRELATRLGFHYIGDALPKSLTLSGTPFECYAKVWNVIDGEPRGVRIIAFDCSVGVGKGRRLRTVIAMESIAGISETIPLNQDMTMDTAGEWKILYRSKAFFEFRIAGLMPVPELEAYLNAVTAERSPRLPALAN
jgi:hypothetical protein